MTTYDQYCYSTAKSFCQAANIMMISPDRYQLPDDRPLVMPFHHLIGFAVELYLKALLASHGLSEKALSSKPYGHNLSNLHEKCVDMCFQYELCSDLCAALEKHSSYEYRYMKGGSEYVLKPLVLLFHQLSGLDNYVDGIVGASNAYGRSPSGSWRVTPLQSAWRLGDHAV